MKQLRALLWALSLCLLLTACLETENTVPDAPPQQNTPPVQTADPPAPPVQSSDLPASIDHLTVELVVDWEAADPLLPQLEDLSQLLREALLAAGHEAEEITVTVNTAGGFTAQALSGGGVDVAWLPAVDFLACEADAAVILTTDDVPCSGVVAVATARQELGGDFQAALVHVLLETEQGTAFLNTCCPGQTYVPATAEAIEAVRDYVQQQEMEGLHHENP